MKQRQVKKNNIKLQNAKYLISFITKAFLISILCFIVLVGFFVSIYFVDLLVNAKDNKSPLFNAFVIVSPSMTPMINVNDAIVIKRVDDDKYNIGDIISFASSDANYRGLTVTHRVIDKEKISLGQSLYTTKGDNNSIEDPTKVATNSIYGRVLFKIPKIGYIQDFLSKPSNFFLCILIPALIFVLYDLGRIFIMMRKRVN